MVMRKVEGIIEGQPPRWYREFRTNFPLLRIPCKNRAYFEGVYLVFELVAVTLGQLEELMRFCREFDFNFVVVGNTDECRFDKCFQIKIRPLPNVRTSTNSI